LLHQFGDLFELNVKLRCQKLNMDKERWWDVSDRERTKRISVPLCAGNDTEQLSNE
jgi:hypothetical protein